LVTAHSQRPRENAKAEIPTKKNTSDDETDRNYRAAFRATKLNANMKTKQTTEETTKNIRKVPREESTRAKIHLRTECNHSQILNA